MRPEIDALAFTSFSVLFLLSRSARRAEHAQYATEKLSRRTLNDGDDVACKLGLLVVVDFVFFEKQESLTFNFNVILFLVKLA